MNEYTAWEPIPRPEEGTCITCRHLDTSIGYLTNPMRYRCKLSGELHFGFDECDVPSLLTEGGTE